MLLDAELFKANVEKLTGKQNKGGSKVNDTREFKNPDDEFFHLTCHLDKVLIEKIKKGHFVELEKLLPGDRFKRDSQRLEFCYKDGATFLAPAEKDKKISNVRRWDQAFRVYASIYCHEHPDRAGEIWQYMEVIHTAAAAYVWDNVAKYDNVFCQLMEFNPKRSWAITYNQMWNLTLVEPLLKNYSTFNNNHNPGNSSGGKRMNGDGTHKKRGSKKSNYCWGLNGKGNFCKFGERCKFINKCSYCDSTQHGKTKCPKLSKDEAAGTVSGNAGSVDK